MYLTQRRHAAAAAILRLRGRAVPSLVRALDDPRPEVVCRLTLILRMLDGDARAAIPALKKLTQSSDPRLRTAALWGLGRLMPQGQILYADYQDKSIIELDRKGETILVIKGLEGLWGVSSLPNGNFLVARCGKGVQEIERSGKVIWKTKAAQNPVYASRLPSDNTLIVDAAGKVIEVDRAHKIVWSYTTRHPCDAIRLSNGNTLVADYAQNEIVEVTLDGEIAWRHAASGPMDIERLSNGNTLIALYTGNAVIELDSKGKQVFEIKAGDSVEAVARTPDGRTIAVGAGWVRIYDRAGKKLTEYPSKRATSVEHN